MWTSVPVTTVICEEKSQRNGKTVMFTMQSSPSKDRVLVPSNVLGMASGKPWKGTSFVYLMMHNVTGRKKNAFVGVSSDPVETMYEYNHGFASSSFSSATNSTVTRSRKRRQQQHLHPVQTNDENELALAQYPTSGWIMPKEAHQAAPYWTLASVTGPAPTVKIAENVANSWLGGIRGVASKFDRGHRLAKTHHMDYYGSDVTCTPETLVSTLSSNVCCEAVRTLQRIHLVHKELECITNGSSSSISDSDDTGDDVVDAETKLAIKAALERVVFMTTLVDHKALKDRTDQCYFTQQQMPIVF